MILQEAAKSLRGSWKAKQSTPPHTPSLQDPTQRRMVSEAACSTPHQAPPSPHPPPLKENIVPTIGLQGVAARLGTGNPGKDRTSFQAPGASRQIFSGCCLVLFYFRPHPAELRGYFLSGAVSREVLLRGPCRGANMQNMHTSTLSWLSGIHPKALEMREMGGYAKLSRAASSAQEIPSLISTSQSGSCSLPFLCGVLGCEKDPLLTSKGVF